MNIIKLQKAAENASRRLSKKSPPHPILEINDEERISILVCQTQDEEGNDYFLISCNGKAKISLPVEKYLHILFRNLRECRIFIKTKTLRLMFINCQGCQISLRAPVIGPAEFFKCSCINLNLRVKDVITPAPVVCLEECRIISIFQGTGEYIYLIKLCDKITGTIVNPDTGLRIQSYELGKLFWDKIERNLVTLSEEDGFVAALLNYELNNIGHILTRDPLSILSDEENNEDDENSVDQIFGCTPPL